MDRFSFQFQKGRPCSLVQATLKLLPELERGAGGYSICGRPALSGARGSSTVIGRAHPCPPSMGQVSTVARRSPKPQEGVQFPRPIIFRRKADAR